MYDESPFISSCTRRQLAQRHPTRVGPARVSLRLPIPILGLVGLVALAIALAALVGGWGGL